MKRAAIYSLAVITASSSAFAADLSARKSAVSAPTPTAISWGGFYVGGNLGYARQKPV